jgi:hypothetical protein
MLQSFRIQADTETLKHNVAAAESVMSADMLFPVFCIGRPSENATRKLSAPYKQRGGKPWRNAVLNDILYR